MWRNACKYVLISALIFSACSRDEMYESFVLVEKGKSLKVSLIKEGDVNNDGTEDLAVGVIKSVRGDTVKRKRLFLFQVRNRAIIPLWLGSRLGKPLEDFSVIKKDSITVVRSIEIEDNGKYLVAEYEWLGFGLTFNRYVKRDISLADAQSLLAE